MLDDRKLCLYKAYEIGDASHKREVKEIMSIKSRLQDILMPLAEKFKDATYNKDKKLDKVKIPIEDILLACNKEKRSCYEYFRSSYTLSNLDYIHLSIAGGYVRNYLLGFNVKTDIDVITDNRLAEQLISFLYELRSDITENVLEYDFCNNTMHLLSSISTSVAHLMIDPVAFDFTINCACISANNGLIYAPAATIHDLEHRIIRPTAQVAESKNITHSIKISLAIRAVRFALKYDMKIHDMLYKGIKLLFFLQNERNTVDDYQMYHALKHLYDDPKDLREEVFSTLKWLGMFETNQFASFDEYFNYIKNRYEQDPRAGRLISGIDFSY